MGEQKQAKGAGQAEWSQEQSSSRLYDSISGV